LRNKHTLYIALLHTLIVASCTSHDGTFRLEGKFKNFNQGEFYLYSLDHGHRHIDTLRLSDGKFAFETAMADSVTFSLIFPNYSELPVFAEPGVIVKINGDATHLKAVEVHGSDANEQMTEFRLASYEKTPPEVLKAAEEFVRNNPQSPVSLYLVEKHFLQKPDADYRKVDELLGLLLKAQPENRRVQQLHSQAAVLRTTLKGAKLPAFNATDTKGNRVTAASLNGDVNVIYTWATWSVESQTMQRHLRKLRKQYGSRLQIIGVAVDNRTAEVKRQAERDSVNWSIVCDGKLWNSPILQKTAIAYLPGNLVIDRSGNILASNQKSDQLIKTIEEKLK
jgi:peroxiredoxin